MILPILLHICYSTEYQKGDEIPIYSMRFGPFDIPLESYSIKPYLPCKNNNESRYINNKILRSNYENTGIYLNFMTDLNYSICSTELTPEKRSQIIHAVEHEYWFKFLIDGMPVLCPFGSVGSGMPEIYTVFSITASFNSNHLIHVNITRERPISLRNADSIELHVKSKWIETETKFENRIEILEDNKVFTRSVHLFSILNSLLLLLMLLVVVALMFTKLQNSTSTLEGDSGWKSLHGDVFRKPPFARTLARLCCLGFHAEFASFLFALLNLMGEQYIDLVELSPKFTFALTISAVPAAFVAVFVNQALDVSSEARSVVALPLTSIGFAIFVNIVALIKGSQCIPFKYLILFIIICIIATGIGLGSGKIANRCMAVDPAPCKISLIPREIPELPPFLQWKAVLPAVGFVCGLPLLVEVDSVLTAAWKHRLFFEWGFLTLTIIATAAIAACTAAAVVFVLLQAECHKWHWVAFSAPAFSGVFVFLYGLYFFGARLGSVGGFGSLCFWFEVLMLAAVIGCGCGSIGLLIGIFFVRSIFSGLKVD